MVRGWSARWPLVTLVLMTACSVAGPGVTDLAETEAGSRPFDLVIRGGRVLDPETGLDGVRHLGIRAGRVAAVSSEPLHGRDVLEAAGLVVAPGFIDLHAHGQDPVSGRFQARDGVTTALELEIGAGSIDRWYREREGRSRLHHGVSVSHQMARRRALGSGFVRRNDDGTFTLGASEDAALYRSATDEELTAMTRGLERGLDQGALGIGVALGYTPGATRSELLRIFELAAARSVPVFMHLRSVPASEPEGRIPPFEEAVTVAESTGASLHVVHLNSTAGAEARAALARLREARARGLDVTTEAYPYTASASMIESALFDDWVDRPEADYQQLQWVATGERLTAETFARYRRQGGWVITHGRSEATNEWVVAQPDVMVASDGIPYTEGRAHPRGAGTFARVLGVYVRERQTLGLMEAIRKMTLLPARRLEGVAPAMARKGRVQVGSDADLTIFDPARVIDRATYERPDAYSEGIVHVLVGGTFVVRDEALVEGVTPGRAIRGAGPGRDGDGRGARAVDGRAPGSRGAG